jgi:predicted MPP superfamily phosphohydrolase
VDQDQLKKFLNGFSATYGCYAVLGNHDYESPVSINSKGDYDIVTPPVSSISRGIVRLFSEVKLTKKTTEQVKMIGYHQALMKLLKETPFNILDNETQTIAIKGTYLNICGLGEYTLGKSLPKKAFRTYDKNFPGIILTHNPDSIPLLKGYPGDIVLCGHTHGGQVYLPWIWKKLTIMENREYLKGLVRTQNKWVYISRGLGSVMPFRWFSRPEITLITLE